LYWPWTLLTSKMMRTLLLENGDIIRLKSTALPQATFIRIQPQSVEFLDISDPKAVLENALRNFSALTKNDIFAISYNDQIYEIQVLEARPENDMAAVSVIETDLEVDFAPPVGYVEPEHNARSKSIPHENLLVRGGIANMLNYESIVNAQAENQSLFKGAGQHLNGKEVKPRAAESSIPQNETTPAPLNVPFGTLFFGYNVVPPKKPEDEESKESSFKGEGTTLRRNKKKAVDGESSK
jgi:ubiquitin fusion degradation protein 1